MGPDVVAQVELLASGRRDLRSLKSEYEVQGVHNSVAPRTRGLASDCLDSHPVPHSRPSFMIPGRLLLQLWFPPVT